MSTHVRSSSYVTLWQKQVTDVSLVLKDSDMGSENLSSLIRLSVSDGQKTDSVSFIGKYSAGKGLTFFLHTCVSVVSDPVFYYTASVAVSYSGIKWWAIPSAGKIVTIPGMWKYLTCPTWSNFIQDKLEFSKLLVLGQV